MEALWVMNAVLIIMIAGLCWSLWNIIEAVKILVKRVYGEDDEEGER